jgi:hypothetical protein
MNLAETPSCFGDNLLRTTFRIVAVSLIACWAVLSTCSPAAAQEKNDAPVDAKTRLNKALTDAASVGKLESVKELLAQGADIHYRDPAANGKTPLVRAIMTGKMELVKYLMENGADIHYRTVRGDTPSTFAASGTMLNC